LVIVVYSEYEYTEQLCLPKIISNLFLLVWSCYVWYNSSINFIIITLIIVIILLLLLLVLIGHMLFFISFSIFCYNSILVLARVSKISFLIIFSFIDLFILNIHLCKILCIQRVTFFDYYWILLLTFILLCSYNSCRFLLWLGSALNNLFSLLTLYSPIVLNSPCLNWLYSSITVLISRLLVLVNISPLIVVSFKVLWRADSMGFILRHHIGASKKCCWYC